MNFIPKKVLFVCTGNAGRSQMAEAMFKVLVNNRAKVFSGGVEPWPDIHPMARKIMAEQGLDLTGHHPKHVRQFVDCDLDVVVTIGDRAEAETPDFKTGVRRIHWDFHDPAEADGTPDSERIFRATGRGIADRLPDLRRIMERIPRRQDMVHLPAVSTILTRPAPFDPEKHLPLFVAAGISAVELTFYSEPEDFPWEMPGAVARLKQVAGDLGIVIASLHPPDRGQLHDESRAVQLNVLKRTADLAAELGAATISCHAGFHLPADAARGHALELLDQSLDELAGHVSAMPVVLCLESLNGASDCISNTEVIARIKARSAAAFGFVLDTGHAHMAGNLQELPGLAGRRLQNLHLHDNDGRRDQHLFPGSGTIDWPHFMQALDHSGYAGPLLLEVHARQMELKDSLPCCNNAFKFLRQAAGKP